jgi:hypothetical protein
VEELPMTRRSGEPLRAREAPGPVPAPRLRGIQAAVQHANRAYLTSHGLTLQHDPPHDPIEPLAPRGMTRSGHASDADTA